MEMEVKGWSVPTCSQEEPWGPREEDAERCPGPGVPGAGGAARRPHPQLQLPRAWWPSLARLHSKSYFWKNLSETPE